MAEPEAKKVKTIEEIFPDLADVKGAKHHDLLREMEGTFIVKGKFFMERGKPPMESLGKSTKTMEMKHFLKQDYTQDGGGFTGVGYTGYSTEKGMFEDVWMDSMGTSMMTSSGHLEPDGRTITFLGKNSKGDEMKGLTVIHNKDHHTFSSYSIADGAWWLTMEMDYQRQK